MGWLLLGALRCHRNCVTRFLAKLFLNDDSNIINDSNSINNIEQFCHNQNGLVLINQMVTVH